MLVLDDNMFKLAKMQEALLRSSRVNREENLANYKKTVIEIDKKAYNDIIEEIKHINEHNQSLESELQFLEKIQVIYEQLRELQLSFKKVCENCGDNDLVLSDLSQLNVEYIENRINLINGYLQNIININNNKERLQILNEQLVKELRKKDSIDRKMLELEETLREKFLNAEGRTIVDGKLQYISIVSEYNNIGYDCSNLLNNLDDLNSELSKLSVEISDATDKLKVAEISYNNMLTAESKQILSDIEKEYLSIKYKLIMLKILKFLSVNYSNYDLCYDKRNKILELIKSRLVCLDKLGIKFSIDPFSMVKVKEQVDEIRLLDDNTKIIANMEKEISELSLRTEQMENQNDNEYKIKLGDTKKLIEESVGFRDIDISMVDLDLNYEEKVIDENQVISVRNISDKLNMHIINQKTSSVIKRVNQMMNGNSLFVKEEPKEIVEPELVIVQSPVEEKTIDDNLELISDFDIHKEIDDDLEFETKDVFIGDKVDSNNDNIFETVTPFSEPILFADKAEDDELTFDQVEFLNSDSIEEKPITNNVVEEIQPEFDNNNSDDLMPDAFWVTQANDLDEDIIEEGNILSFDDQIDFLLSSETDNKVKKKVA